MSQSLNVSAAAYGNVRLRECKNTEFAGYGVSNKAAVSRAVRLRECPLRELRLYEFSAVLVITMVLNIIYHSSFEFMSLLK